jgi:hypothetical protein
MRKFWPGYCLIVALISSLFCCTFTAPVTIQKNLGFQITAEPWPEAEQLFRDDDHWLGGDGASSVDLGGGRVLWLFGDSFINPSTSGKRSDSIVVRNSVAIQKGYDPSAASVDFYWNTVDEKPASFFLRKGNSWYWPGDGIRVNDILLIFLMEICESDNELGFDVTGWRAVLIENPDENPGHWRMRWLGTPEQSFGTIIGSACVIGDEDYIYAFSTDAQSHVVYLVRWAVSSVLRGDLSAPKWWDRKAGAWVLQDMMEEKPCPLFTEGQMEFSAHYEPLLKKYLQIQTASFMDPRISFRSAKDITGPWSSSEGFYMPGQAGQEDIMIYAAKLHPALTGADFVLTYSVNTNDYERLLKDRSIYYPVFLKGKLETEPQN